METYSFWRTLGGWKAAPSGGSSGQRPTALDNGPARRQAPAMRTRRHFGYARASPARAAISSGPYASSNCSLSGGDSRDAVLENRARAGDRRRALVGLMQVHGTGVVGSRPGNQVMGHVPTPW